MHNTETHTPEADRPSTLATVPGFDPVPNCWICGEHNLRPVHEDVYELAAFAAQDPELATYTGRTLIINRCATCGFMQPAALPDLHGYFDRIYDQKWSEDWIEQEFVTGYKDYIFRKVLDRLDRYRAAKMPAPRPHRLLDVGSHVGRLMHLAHQRGWAAEGIELNPRTSTFAQRRTGLPVWRVNAHDLVVAGRTYSAVTVIDVLEHIPDPVRVLRTLFNLLKPGGIIAIKVPCGRNQLLKERVRSALREGYRASIAGNLVHVSHFTAGSLQMALVKAGFECVSIEVGAPELPPRSRRVSLPLRADCVARLGTYFLGRILPGGVHMPWAFNLQAYARRR